MPKGQKSTELMERLEREMAEKKHAPKEVLFDIPEVAPEPSFKDRLNQHYSETEADLRSRVKGQTVLESEINHLKKTNKKLEEEVERVARKDSDHLDEVLAQYGKMHNSLNFMIELVNDMGDVLEKYAKTDEEAAKVLKTVKERVNNHIQLA